MSDKVWIINKRFLLIIGIVLFVLIFFVSFHHPQGKVYHNCSQLEQDGHFNIPRSSRLYLPQLDANKNGIACER